MQRAGTTSDEMGMTKSLLTLLLFSGMTTYAQRLVAASYETSQEVVWTDRDHDPCAPYRARYSTVLSGRSAARDTLTLASGARISGEFNEAPGFDRGAVENILGAPSSVAGGAGGETKLIYRYVACLGAVTLNARGYLVHAELTPIEQASPRARTPETKEQVVAKEPILPEAEQAPRIPGPVTRLTAPEVQKPSAGRGKQILRWTLVTVGVGALGYYGYKARGTGSGNCNVASDRAADGSRCGGRAASERPGGRP